MPTKGRDEETCDLCGCTLVRTKEYAKDTPEGRAGATKHHYVAERFYGRSANRRGTTRTAIFQKPPFPLEKDCGTFCYECHEEVLHNIVLLPEDIATLSKMLTERGLSERTKPSHRQKVAGRIRLLHEVVRVGLDTLIRQ